MKSVKMSLKKGDIVELFNVLSLTHFDSPIDSKFRYVASKNVKIAKEQVDEITAAFSPPEELPKYQKERISILEKHKVKNDNDYKELAKEVKEGLDKELSVLDEKYKDLREELTEMEKEKRIFLDEIVEISLYKIPVEFIPTISQIQENIKLNGWEIWSVIEKLIDEEEIAEENQLQDAT